MASEAEESLGNSTLTSLEAREDSQYDDRLGARIPLDIADYSKSNEDDLIQLNTAAGQTQIDRSKFPHNENHDKASTAVNLHLPKGEDFVDIRDIDSDIGDIPARTAIEPESNTSLQHSPDVIIKQEDPISDVGIPSSNLETQMIDLCESDGDQDAMDVEKDSNLPVKTEESDVPFVWTDMGSDTIELSDSNQEEVQELSRTQIRGVRRISEDLNPETSSPARVHGSGNVTGAGSIFGDFRGQASRFTEPTEIDDDDSDVSDEGAR